MQKRISIIVSVFTVIAIVISLIGLLRCWLTLFNNSVEKIRTK